MEFVAMFLLLGDLGLFLGVIVFPFLVALLVLLHDKTLDD